MKKRKAVNYIRLIILIAVIAGIAEVKIWKIILSCILI